MNDQPLDPAATDTPVKFDASPLKGVAGTLGGALLILLTGLPTLLGLLKAHDLAAIIVWTQGPAGVSYISAAGLVATLVWRTWARIHDHAKSVVAARAAPDDKAIVVGDPPK